jgi:CubicO group peptidase (beta-lactamase class C family)
VLVRWVLAHRAGLAEVEGEFAMDDVIAWHPIAEQLARQAPQWPPGTRHGYHMRSYGWLVGELVRRITGLSLGRYFATEIAGPLALDFHIGLPRELEERVATLYAPPLNEAMRAFLEAAGAGGPTARIMSGPSNLFAYDDRWNTRPYRAAEMPSSNGIGTARSLARLYAACVGPVEGNRVLSDATVARACHVQSDGPDCVLGMPMTFGLGFALPPALAPGVGPRAFGHPGAGGSLGYADPDAGIGFGYAMNQMRFDATGDPRTATLIEAVMACV